jgi:hypothetical protein
VLTPDQIKPYILHSEIIVSRAAISYFSESNLYLNNPSLMPLILQKLKQLNKGETIYLHQAYPFEQSRETVSELVELLDSTHTDANTKFHLAKILINSELSLLEPYLNVLAQQEGLFKQIQARIDISNMENTVLFEAFENFLKTAYGKYMNEIDTFYGDELIHELARRKCVTPDHLLHVLDSHDPDEFGYETIYYAQLAGEMQLEAAIPLLCGFLGAEDDVLPEYAMHALVRIGTEAVVTTLAEKYTQATEEYYRLYASDVFGKIKLPASEEALLALLPGEENLTHATKLANGLCELGSIKGIPMIQALVEDGYDSGYLDLKESLYAHCVISGIQLPQMNLWKLDLEAEERRQAKRKDEMDWLWGGDSPVNRGKRISESSSTPYVNSNKAGRNDPCPCGSGKKYKKCCGSA